MLLLSKTTFQCRRLIIRLKATELLVLIIALAVFWSLAFWQLNRSSEKQLEQLKLAEKMQAAPVSLLSLEYPAQPHHQWKKVFVTGRYIDQSILIENAYFRGQRGYEVFTPFKLSSGGPLLLVSRGWHIGGKIPLTTELTNNDQQLIGVVNLPLSNAFFLEPTVADKRWPVTMHHFQLDTIKTLYNMPLMDVVLRLQSSQPGLLKAHWSNIVPKTTNHIAYALQWFVFSLIALVTYIIRNSNAIELLQQPTINNKQ